MNISTLTHRFIPIVYNVDIIYDSDDGYVNDMFDRFREASRQATSGIPPSHYDKVTYIISFTSCNK